MKLVLHPGSNELQDIYGHAFRNACELYIVSAYLTAWKPVGRLNSTCKSQMIIGADFGLTGKKACRTVLEWLPKRHKNELYVANHIGGFHPKAMAWKNGDGKHYILVGSSNLTEAAFRTNYESNLLSAVSKNTYNEFFSWFYSVRKGSRPVDNNWLAAYKESNLKGGCLCPRCTDSETVFRTG